jgi:hypothetical protein
MILVLFTKYVFPGTHERHLYTCNSNEDCGTNADENGVKCGFIDGIEQNYKVCQCKTGYVFNPIDSTCGIIKILSLTFICFSFFDVFS